MLSVCLIFLYILSAAYLAGYLCVACIRRICAQEILSCHITSGGYVMAGLVGMTVFAQFFSLFYKVGLAANLLLLFVCILALALYRRQMGRELAAGYRNASNGKKVFYFFLFLLFAYGTSRGIIHYDTGLYHAQSIRWIEEYGVVRGLGNLHCRLAYNSASFGLSALFSFSFLGGQSYHCTAGIFALLLAKECSGLFNAWRRKRILISDIARIMGIYYLLIIFDEMIAPASDYFMVLTYFYIVIRYLDLAEAEEKSWFPYALLALMCVYTMSIKLSAACILLLSVKPAVMLVKKKNIRGILCFIALGILIILPFLIRNVLISGWIVYPFTFADFFNVDWKIPKGMADYDAKEIQVWGRGVYDVARYAEPVRSWFGGWFVSQGIVDRVFIISGIAAVPVSAVAYITAAVKKLKKQKDIMLALAMVNLSFLFWLFSAPLIRYGCVYVWLAAPLTFGAAALWLIRYRLLFWRIVYSMLILAGCYKLAAFGGELINGYTADYFIYQKDYDNFEVECYRIDKTVFYYPVKGDRTGYDAFPSAPSKAAIVLRGDGLEDGFRYKE